MSKQREAMTFMVGVKWSETVEVKCWAYSGRLVRQAM